MSFCCCLYWVRGLWDRGLEFVCLFICFGLLRHPFHLSTFTLDEFEQAIRHSIDSPPCELLAEVHSALLYNLRTVPFTRHAAVTSLWQLKEEEEESTLR